MKRKTVHFGLSVNLPVAEQEQALNLQMPENGLTPFRRTRRIYDLVAPFYPISSRLFHARAHAKALEALDLKDGSRVLEVAMGSGEMFQRLVRRNARGQNIGIDFSANMAARSQANARRNFPAVAAHCPCADARRLPFRDHCFEALICCYLFELLAESHTREAIDEFRRVLKPGGQLALISVAENESTFNLLYKTGAKVAPAFWGRQVSAMLPDLLRSGSFAVKSSFKVRQLFFRSQVNIALNKAR